MGVVASIGMEANTGSFVKTPVKCPLSCDALPNLGDCPAIFVSPPFVHHSIGDCRLSSNLQSHLCPLHWAVGASDMGTVSEPLVSNLHILEASMYVLKGWPGVCVLGFWGAD